jgi:hypothetical protein
MGVSPPDEPDETKKKIMNPPRPPAPKVPRDEKGRVLPGHSLNPGGRHKGAAERAREILDRAGGWELLEEVLEGHHDATLQQRLDVADMLVNRGYGKAVAVQVTADATPEGVLDVGQLDLEGLVALRRLQQKAVGLLPASSQIVDVELEAPEGTGHSQPAALAEEAKGV